MSDLIALMSQLVDNKGKLLVPGIYDTVAKLTPEEEKLYDAIDFDMVSHIFQDCHGTGKTEGICQNIKTWRHFSQIPTSHLLTDANR